MLPPDPACFLGGQHGGHPDGERVDRSGRDRWLTFCPCASLGSSSEGPALRAPGTLAPSLLSVRLGLPSSRSFTFLVCKIRVVIITEPPWGLLGAWFNEVTQAKCLEHCWWHRAGHVGVGSW